MTWFFVNAGQQAGPISDIQLDQYIRAGKILPDTLLWREGMDNWQPCQEVKSAALLKAPLAAMAPTIGKSTPIATPEIVCAECGALHPRDNAIKHGDSWICAACKPIHIQKIKEGVASKAFQGAMDYAGIGARAVAKLLDGLIIGLPGVFLIGVVVAVGVPTIARKPPGSTGDTTLLLMVAAIALIAFAMVFFQIWCLPKYGATPGKRIMGLRVVTAEGGAISWGRAIGRFFGEWINGLIPFWIGYIIAAFDPERRTVHDHIAGTRVIKV